MRKVYIIITSSIVLLGIGIFFLFYHEKITGKDTDHRVTPDMQTATYEEQRAKVEKINAQNAEIYNTAMREQSTILCDKIMDTDKKTECHDMIRATQAKKAGTIETCDMLTATGVALLCRDAISSDRAMTDKNKSLCYAISDKDRRVYCIESIDEEILRGHIEDHTVTREFCHTLSDKYQSDCIAEIREIDETTVYRDAIAKNDLKLCSQITNIELRDTCRNTVNLKLAVSTGKSDLCETILDTDKKLYCQNQVSKMSDITLYKTAITGTDTEKCSSIKNENLRNKCHDTIIITTVKNSKNKSLCENLTNTGIIASCQQIVQ